MTAHKFSFGPMVWWTGVVEDNSSDPQKIGRCKVRIYGYHSSSTSDIPTAHLHWAIVGMPTTSAGVSGVGESPSGIVNGSTVYGFFLDGEDAQAPLIIGTMMGMPGAGDPSSGFNDPDGVYPKYNAGESDVNRLARGEGSQHEMIQTMQSNQVKGVSTAGGGTSWNQPNNPAGPVYPKNHVRESEAGHVEEWDDTPGKERLNRYHKSGTYEQIGPDGTRVHQIVKDNYELISGNDFVQIKGNVNIMINGDSRVSIQGDAYLDVTGNMKTQVQGDYDLTVQGTLNLQVSGDYNNTAGGTNNTKASIINLN